MSSIMFCETLGRSCRLTQRWAAPAAVVSEKAETRHWDVLPQAAERQALNIDLLLLALMNGEL
jgi:hypothetical protein